MSESKKYALSNNSEIENESFEMINSSENQSPTKLVNLSLYASKNSTKINLSGKDLQIRNNKLLFKTLVSANPNAIIINLNNCNLSTFPKELLDYKNLFSLDIRNNHFTDFDSLVEKLVTFESLADLKMDLTDQNQVFTVLTQLPKLIFLNGRSTKEEINLVDINEKDIQKFSLQSDLKVYNYIIELINEKASKKILTTDFQTKLFEEEKRIKSLKKNLPNYIYANNVIKSQFSLMEFLTDKYLLFLDEETKNIGKVVFEAVFQSGKRCLELIEYLYPVIEAKTGIMKNQLEDAWKEVEEVSEFIKKYNEMKKANEFLKNEIELMKIKLNSLEKENQALLQKLVINSKMNSNVFNNDSSSNININNINENDNNNDKINNENNKNEQSKIFNIKNKIIIKDNISKYINKNNYINNNNINNNNYDLNNNKNNINNYNSPRNIQKIISPKILTIKMAKDIINDIYSSKENYDKICYENKLPRETMEEHMYTYLNQKYGLKKLIIEWAATIINAIKMYSSEDSDINLFGKILRNEQEEDSRFMLSKLKENISEVLEFHIKSKNQYKSKTEIKKILRTKKEGYLNEEEWRYIVNYLYPIEEAKTIENKIIKFIQNQNDKNNDLMNFYSQSGIAQTEVLNSSSTNNVMNVYNTFGGGSTSGKIKNNLSISFSNGSAKKLSREVLFNLSKFKEELNIQYKHLLKILCDHQIKIRDKYLKNFIQLFRKYDTDCDGILNENEFIGLIKDIPYCKDNADNYIYRFLTLIDPFNNKKITFSECVSLLSQEMIDGPKMNGNQEENPNNENMNVNNDVNTENNNKEKVNNIVNLLDKICLGEPIY